MWLPLPDGVDYEQAGVALWPFSSSHRVVRDRLQVKPGDNVLVTGASGGMGQATLQLAKLAGARVIATTRHEAKAAMLRELGADAVVVTADEDQAVEGHLEAHRRRRRRPRGGLHRQSRLAALPARA